MSKLDYDRSFMALKALAARDLEPGTKDVSFLICYLLFSYFFYCWMNWIWVALLWVPVCRRFPEFHLCFLFSQQVAHCERVFPEAHEAIKSLYEIIGESSATKAVEGYAPYRPGDITVPTSSTPKRTNKLARRHASFFHDDSDDDMEEVSILRGDLKKIFAQLTTADRLERLVDYFWSGSF